MGIHVQLSKIRADEKIIKLVCHTQLLVVTESSEPWVMGDVGDQRLATAVERITEFIAEQFADSDSCTHTAASSKAGNPSHAEEESSGISSGDIPCVPSESDGNHWPSSSRSSTCAPPSGSEARPNFGAVLDKRDEMIEYLCLDLANEQTVEANETYELLLLFASTKTGDFFSPTPPFEALWLLLSHAGSGMSSSTGGRKILVV